MLSSWKIIKSSMKNPKPQILLFGANTNYVLLGTVSMRLLQNILFDKASCGK